jgi:hypothetical protein
MKKNILAVLFVIFFICGLAQSAGADETIWREVTSNDDIVGEWEGKFSIPVPANTENLFPETSFDMTMLMEYVKGKSLNLTLTMDMDRFLTDMLSIPEVKNMGLSKDALWEMFIITMVSDNRIKVGKKYYIQFFMSEEADEFLFDSSKGEVLIDDSKSKIKLVFYEGLSFGFLDEEEITEIILTKK